MLVTALRVALLAGLSALLAGFAPVGDTDPPQVDRIRPQGTPDVTDRSRQFYLEFNEAAFNVTADDIEITAVSGDAGGTISEFLPLGGNRSFRFRITFSGQGEYRVDFKANTNATDTAGNGAGVNGYVPAFTGGDTYSVDRTPPAAPSAPDMAASSDTGVSDTDNITKDRAILFTGTGEPGATLFVRSDHPSLANLGSTTVGGDGTWSFTSPVWTGSGAQNIYTVQRDSGFNDSPQSPSLAIEIDSSAPNAGTLVLDTSSDTGQSDTDGVTSDTTPTLNGTTEPNAIVRIENNGTVFADGVADATGAFSLTTTALAEGEIRLGLRAEDRAGNAVSYDLALVDLTIDTTAPDAPAAPQFAHGADTGVSTSDRVTSNQTPPITGTGGASFGVVSIFSSIDGPVGTGSTSFSGGYTVTTDALSEGVHTFTVETVDPAGNASTASPPSEALTLDLTDPRLTAIARRSPAAEQPPEGTTSLAFDITFDEPVSRAQAGDFVINGTTATGQLTGSGADYVLTITGGDLAYLNGTVSVDLDPASDIIDLAGNAITAAEPGVDESYTLANDTTAPSIASVVRLNPAQEYTNADTLVWRVTFSEPVVRVASGEFNVNGSTATASVSQVTTSTYDVTASGGDLAGLGTAFVGAVSLSVRPGSSIRDRGGNALDSLVPTGVSEGYRVANAAPRVGAIERLSNDPTNFNSVSWTVRIDTLDNELDLTAANFSLAGTTAGLDVLRSYAGNFRVTASGGDLPDLNGVVTLSVNAGITDRFGNAMTDTTPTNENENTVTLDNTRPELTWSADTSGLVNAPFELTATFSEDVTGFELSDLRPQNATLADFNAVSAQVYTLTVRPTATGPVVVSMTGTARDAAGNSRVTPDPFELAADFTAPRVLSITRETPADQHTNADTLTWTVLFDEAVENVDGADFQAAGTTASTSATGSGESWRVTAAGGDLADLEGLVSLRIASGATIADLAGNVLVDPTPQAPGEAYTVSNTAPVLAAITRAAPTDALTNADALTWDFNFSTISGTFSLKPRDLVLTGTTASLAVERYSIGFNVTASGGDLAELDGEVTIALASGVTDEFGNVMATPTPSGANENSYTLDNSAPGVSITPSAAGPVSGAFTLTFRFTEDVDGFGLSNLVVGNGSADNFAGSGAVYTVDIMPAADGPVTVDVQQGAATDTAGNPINTPPQFSIDADLTAPRVLSVDLFPGTVSPTDADVISWGVRFSEPIDRATLSGADFTASGTSAVPTVSEVDPDYYEVSLANGDMAELNADVTLSFAASAGIADLAGNPVTDFTVEGVNNDTISVINDTTPPGVTISSASSDPVAGPFTIAIDFTETVTGFVVGDLSVAGGTAGSFAGSDDSYTAEITPSGDGTITVDIAAGVAEDAAGNGNTAAAQFSILSDGTAPEVYITTTSADPVSGAFTIDIKFTEAVTGFDVSDLTVSGGTAGSFTGSDDAYTAEITPSGDGTITVDIATGAAQDAAGNANTAAEQFSIESDGTAPGVEITTDSADPVSGAFTIAITFTEPVTGFEVGDLTVVGGAAGSFSGSGDSYEAEITPSGDGTITVDIEAGAAQDAAGNASTAAAQFWIQSDSTAPALTIALPGEDVTGVFTARFSFSEAVSDFELVDIVVTNGEASSLSTSDDTVFTAEITPEAPGTVTVTVAAGAAQDAAGNTSFAAEAAIEAVADADNLSLVLGSDVTNPGDVAANAAITNPGNTPLTVNATTDASWLDVTPPSGTIAPLGTIDITVSLNGVVDTLAPGAYNATVTIASGGGSGPTGAMTTASSTPGAVLLTIPVSLQVQPRFGDVTLVATTPSGASGQASFGYASDIAAFDGLTLTTTGGRASAESGSVLQGAYQISQSLPAGWRTESISCAGDIDGGSSFDVETGSAVIDLDPNEALVCTFENVRDEDAVRLATQRAIRGFMVRRADRIVEAAPDLSRRFSERETTERGAFAADVDGSGRYQMSLAGSLSGLRNAAAAATPDIPGVTNYERPFMDGWDVWFAAEITGVTDDRAGEGAESDFGIAQLGVDYQVSDAVILGLLAQYDWMKESSEEIFAGAGAIAGARVEGEGWMAGPYAVWRIRDSLIFDATALYGTSDNHVDPLGLYTDEFETDRFMLSANLSGEFASGPWRVRPQAGITHFEETQSAYTDSLGVLIPEQSVTLGRFRAGPELAWRRTGANGGWLELTTALTAKWDYEPAELLTEAGVLTGGDDDLRVESRFELSSLTPWGAYLRLESGFDGLGVGDFEGRSLRFEIRIPFGAQSAGGGGSAGARLAAGRPFAQTCDGFQSGFEQALRGHSDCDTEAR